MPGRRFAERAHLLQYDAGWREERARKLHVSQIHDRTSSRCGEFPCILLSHVVVNQFRVHPLVVVVEQEGHDAHLLDACGLIHLTRRIVLRDVEALPVATGTMVMRTAVCMGTKNGSDGSVPGRIDGRVQ